jgi:glucose-1-phosphate cytidylyltransferase
VKVIILAGGKGSRLSEYTKLIPKPMVKIVKIPIIVRIINHYLSYGFNDFLIAGGFKSKIIQDYFKKNLRNLNIKIVNTGINSMTGGRIKILKKYIKGSFMLTYGDGVCDVNLKKLLSFHKKNKYLATLTAVRPPARFGGIKISKNTVKYFKEKSKLDAGWINGGFFVMEPEILKFIKDKQTVLEQYPLEKLSKSKKLGAYKHFGFWQCVDTIRDKEILEQAIKRKIYK